MLALAAAVALSLQPAETPPVPAYGVEAPRLERKRLPRRLPEPYDASRDARADILAAFERAESSGKFVLVDFGGNWCPDCRILAGMTELPGFAEFMAASFETVYVDIGRFDRNMELMPALGIAELEGVPTVVIVTPQGHVLNQASSAAWVTTKGRDPQEALDYFARFAPRR